MDVTRVVPRAGFMVAVAMALALALASAAAAAPSTVGKNAGGDGIVYVDPNANDDSIFLAWEHHAATDTHEHAIGFSAEPAPEADTTGCTDRGALIFCGPDIESLVAQLGGGDDVLDLTDPSLAGHAVISDITGGSGDDRVEGGAAADDFGGGSDDDTLVGLTDGDRFRGHAGIDTLDLRAGGPWTVTLNGVPDDGAAGAAATANVGVDVEVVLGGPGGDDLTGGPGADTLSGAGGDDILEGGAGGDQLSGGAGLDTVLALDGLVDTVSCGADADTVFADWNDIVGGDCESVTRAARDDDGDGSPSGVDCDDANANVKPGGGDVPGNGLDEDCDGGDAVVDADGDGAAAGADCDDANAARFPGATEVPANGVDEDCDGRDGAFPAVAATVASGWKVFAAYTKLTSLKVKGAPPGAKVRVTCKGKRKGCPFRTRTATVGPKGRVGLTKRFKGAELRPGAVIEVRVSAPGAIAKVLRITIRDRKAPKRVTLCLPPGASKPRSCG